VHPLAIFGKLLQPLNELYIFEIQHRDPDCNRKRSVMGGLTGCLKIGCFQNFKKLSDRSVTLSTHKSGFTCNQKKVLTFNRKLINIGLQDYQMTLVNYPVSNRCLTKPIDSTMKFVGVDGCSKGWFAVAIQSDWQGSVDIFPDISDLWAMHQDAALILIDIPIGLPFAGARRCDIEARRILKHWRSSIFPAPARETLAATNYRDACRINHQVLGKKISIQTWRISHKIKEVDALLIRDPKARQLIRESHPEVCFWALAGGCLMSASKKTVVGISERLTLLQHHHLATISLFELSKAKYARQQLALDDIVDALALVVTAAAGIEHLQTIPAVVEEDREHLPMAIVYTNRYLSVPV
jgi:predicted RNase H-like nuclease